MEETANGILLEVRQAYVTLAVSSQRIHYLSPPSSHHFSASPSYRCPHPKERKAGSIIEPAQETQTRKESKGQGEISFGSPAKETRELFCATSSVTQGIHLGRLEAEEATRVAADGPTWESTQLHLPWDVWIYRGLGRKTAQV